MLTCMCVAITSKVLSSSAARCGIPPNQNLKIKSKRPKYFLNYKTRAKKIQKKIILTCSQAMHSSVMISKSGTAFLSFLLNISMTIESKFHIPSGSLPRKGRNSDVHSAAAGGAVVDKQLTSLKFIKKFFFFLSPNF